MNWFGSLKADFEAALLESINTDKFKNLYVPVKHILSIGGKRIRPVSLLKANQAYAGSLTEAMPAALAVEWFHNFSLVHDDLMDHADTRRGTLTVHKKFNSNQAILSGDVMLARANQMIAQLELDNFKEISQLFNQTAIEVCEGQQMDMDFETEELVGIQEYLQMIRLKTGVLFAASLKIGALIAGASASDADNLYEFGINAGLAFQIQDDYLDTYGEADFGKVKGGDIMQGKKTFLVCKALELANESEKEQLIWQLNKNEDRAKAVAAVTAIYSNLKVPEAAIEVEEEYFEKALIALDKCEMEAGQKADFNELAKSMMVRTI